MKILGGSLEVWEFGGSFLVLSSYYYISAKERASFWLTFC